MIYNGHEIDAVKVKIGGILRDVDISGCIDISDVEALVARMREDYAEAMMSRNPMYDELTFKGGGG